VIQTPEITGANALDFAFISNCPDPLPKKRTCTIEVTATPGDAGNRSATLLIHSNDLKKPTVPVGLKVIGKQ
jgi:hypothetical protein